MAWVVLRRAAAGVARVALVTVPILLAVGCGSTITVQTHRDPTIRIASGATYAWNPTPPADRHPAELDPRANNPTIHGRVRRAVESVLASKGFRQVDWAAAELLVNYRVGVMDRMQHQQAVTGGPGARHMTVRTIEFTEGGLLIDLLERSTGKLAFRALGVDDVTKEDSTEKAILDAVSLLLRDLP